MSFNVVLRSADSISYASGKAQFKVHWGQFLTDGAKYKLSFSFISEVVATLDHTDLYELHLDNIGATPKMIAGGDRNSSTSMAVGFIYSEEPHSTGASADARLRAEYSTNPPVDLLGRPDLDVCTVSFRDITGALSAKTPAFTLFLRFEHCGCV
jgi:hypothetical protein